MPHFERSKFTVVNFLAVQYEPVTFLRAVQAFVLAMFLPSIGAASENSQYFSITMNDNLIGYAMVNCDQLERDGRMLLRLKSETSLKSCAAGSGTKNATRIRDFDRSRNEQPHQLPRDRHDE